MRGLSVRFLPWVFASPAAVVTLALVIVHQSIIASSAYFLTQTISSYQAGREIAGYLVLYFLSMTIPFIPGCLSFVTTRQWINAVHRKFALAMTSTVYGNIDEYRSAERKSAFESAISRNSFDVIASYVMLSHDFVSLALNSVLSLVVIGFILPTEIVWGYGVSLMLSAAMVWALSKAVKKLSVETETQYSHYGNTLGKAWDNAVLGNAYNYRLWLEEFGGNGGAYYSSSLRLTAYKQFGNIAIAMASLIPTAYLVYRLLVQAQIEAAIIAAIIVNLTRIFHILNSMSALVYELVEWASASARLQYLSAFVKPAVAGALPQTPSGKVTVNGDPVTDYQALQDVLQHRRAGRMTIRGENGSGKSTLLLSIKQAFPDQAHLLPAGNPQLCWRSGQGNVSTGQRACAIIDEILQQGTNIRYLLLDEWDANLDRDNRTRIDGVLDGLSKEKVVIEVRH
ncbi:ABC transporter ATP-binding protein [Bordetella tumulicola]|uniref:ATP-binding cassette domain-containing protein n=1 Tax=Bordetella tumulicola TaxID=1649133 RepID=UPI0039F08A44